MEEKERRVSSHSQVVRNPFIQPYRDNFPGLDRAIGLDDDHDHRRAQHEQHGSFYDDRVSPDQSICSHQTSSSLQNSSLNMSIGARAALNEHLRQVALHGIDGQQPPTDTSLSFERLPQDEIWDRLMDGNVSITSTPSPTLIDRLQAIVSISEDGEETVEVVADTSSDFFNSSRIWQLSTPEKNKRVQRHITTRRGPDPYEESDSGSQESGMMYLYNMAVGMHADQASVDHSTSLLSIGVDLSRISHSDVSDIRSSPDEVSFHQRNIFEDYSTHSPARLSCRVDPSFSTPSRRGILSQEPSMFSPSRQSFSTVRGYGEKENYMNLSSDIGLSPIAAQAGSIAVKLGRPSRRHYPGDTFPSYSPGSGASPNELVNRMENLRMDEPSPISQANSGFDMRTFPTVSENCILDMDGKGDSSKSSSSPIGLKPRDDSFQKRASSLSSISASVSKQQSSPLSEDRRRYRTVVPARVFMDEPENFPIQNDSFSSRSATATSTSDDSGESSLLRLPARSLLVSFDAAVDEYEVPLTDS